MTKEYSLKKKNSNWQISFFIVTLLLLIASIALYVNVSRKPKIELVQIDLNAYKDTDIVADSFTIAVLNENILNTIVIKKDVKTNQKYLTIIESLKENMTWPEAVRVDNVIGLEHKHKNYAIVNLTIDRSIPITISIQKERDILNSIGQTLKLNGADDFRILINDQESDVFIKNLSLISGLD